MNDLLQKLRERGKQILDGFTPGQKAVSGIAVLVVVIGGYLFTSWAAKPSYSPLFSGLAPEDAAKITEALDTRGTPHKLAAGGATILVPAGDVYEARIALSAEGLPSEANSGWGLLDEQGITTSEFQQRTGFQRALEGELSNTITAIDGVDGADVHLVIPKEDLFTDDQQRATASVLLTLDSSSSMSAMRVQSVVNLVASAVEGLAPDAVTVSDSAGNLLSAPGEDGADLAAGDFRAQQTRAKELEQTRKIQEQLERLVGPNGADVRVSLELNFDDEEVTEEQFDGTDAPVVSETTNEETFTGSNPGTGGALGPNNAPIDTDASQQDYTKTQAERVNAVDKTTTKRTRAPGQIVKQTVSVLLDQNAGGNVALATVQAQVEAAAGIDAERGDVVEVARAPFDTTERDAEQQRLDDAAASARMQDLMNLVKTIGTLLLVGFGLLFGYRRLRTQPTEETIPLEQLALQAGDAELLELDEEDIVELEPARARDLVTYEGDDEPSTVLVSRRHRRELDRLPGIEERLAENADIADLIDRQPEDVAQLLRGWMAERR